MTSSSCSTACFRAATNPTSLHRLATDICHDLGVEIDEAEQSSLWPLLERLFSLTKGQSVAPSSMRFNLRWSQRCNRRNVGRLLGLNSKAPKVLRGPPGLREQSTHFFVTPLRRHNRTAIDPEAEVAHERGACLRVQRQSASWLVSERLRLQMRKSQNHRALHN